MARPREFDEAYAIDAAMRAFWASGYEGTSTQALCDATGLGRSSIYNTFKSKHDLFTRALGRYVEVQTGEQLELLAGDEPVRERVRATFDRVIDSDRVGCLVVNTTIELAPRDPQVAELLRRDYDRRIDALRTALGGADDALALAHFVTATVSGMRVAAANGAGRDVLAGIAETALGVLDGRVTQ